MENQKRHFLFVLSYFVFAIIVAIVIAKLMQI